MPDASWLMAIRQGTPPPFWYSPRTVWPGPFGAIMIDVDGLLRFDQIEMDVEAMGKGNRRAITDIGGNVGLVDVGLQFVGRCHHQQVAPLGGLGNGHHLEAIGFRLLDRGRTGLERDRQVLGPESLRFSAWARPWLP